MLRLQTMHRPRFSLLTFLLLAVLLLGACHRSPEAKKAKFVASGKAFMEAKDYPRAILQFRNAVQVAPKDPEMSYQLALAYIANRDVKTGYMYLLQATNLDAHYTPARLKLDELKAGLGGKTEVEQAQSELTRMLEKSPGDADLLSALGVAEFRLSDTADAQQHLEAALQKAPANLKAAVALARIKAKTDRAGAEQILKSAVANSPKSADPLVALAGFYLWTQQFADAERMLRQALEIDPKNDPALLGLATVQVHNGQKDQAEQTYARLSALPQTQYKSIHAAFLFQEGKRDAALAEFAKLAKESPEDRTARTRLVIAYLKANRIADAKNVLDEALKHNSKDVDALMQRAEISLNQGDYNNAQTDLEQALRYRPDSGVAHFLRARVHMAKREWSMETQELGQALQLDKSPRMLPARLELAEAHMRRGDAKAALALLDGNELTAQQKRLLGVVVLRNYALIRSGDLDRARTEVDHALKVIKTPDLMEQDAELKVLKHDYAGARVSLEAILKDHPENLPALEMLARTYATQQQMPAAIKVIRDHAASQPKSAHLQKFLGDWLFMSGDHNGAMQAYATAKQLDPQLTAADLAMAKVDLADNKLDAARKVMTSLMQTNPTTAEPFFVMGMVEEKSGNFEQAVINYRKVLTMDSHNAVVLNNLAFLLADHGQPQQLDEALKLAQEVRALVPANASIDDTMGWAYYKKGIYRSAIEQLEDAEKLDAQQHTQSALHQYHLAMAYFMNNDPKRGNEKLAVALRLNPNLPEAQQARNLLAQAKTKTAAN